MAFTGEFRYLPAYQHLGFPSSIRFTHDSLQEWAKSTSSTSWMRMNKKAPAMPTMNQARTQKKDVILTIGVTFQMLLLNFKTISIQLRERWSRHILSPAVQQHYSKFKGILWEVWLGFRPFKACLPCAQGSLGADIPNGTISPSLHKGIKNHSGNPQMSLDIMVKKSVLRQG